MKGWVGIVARCAALFVIFSMIFSNTSDTLRRPDDESDEIHAFYSEPKDTIDVLYLGSSPMLRGVSPMIMYEEQGFTGYVRASALQPPTLTYGLLEESLEYQTPELVVILSDNIFLEYDFAEREGDLRRGMDGMKVSKHKIRVINEITEADPKQTMLSYLFPLFRYHERWKEVDIPEAEPTPLMEHSFKKGNVFLKGGEPRAYPEGFMDPTGKEAPAFNKEAKYYYEKAILTCKEKGIPVLILHMPKMAWSNEESEALANFAKEIGVDYLDCDIDEIRSQLGLNPAEDYYDQGHLNLGGMKKYSSWLGEYLKTEYDLPDRRNDPVYKKWDEDLALYKEAAEME